MVSQSLLKLKWWQSATAKAGPSCGAAMARNLPTSSPAWHFAQLSPKTELFAMDRTWVMACVSSSLLEALLGSGCGSLVSFCDTEVSLVDDEYNEAYPGDTTGIRQL